VGSSGLRKALNLSAREFAEEYYERNIPLSAVKHIYKHQPLTDEIIAFLSPDLSFADLKVDIENICRVQ
jgi:hypothetical protein